MKHRMKLALCSVGVVVTGTGATACGSQDRAQEEPTTVTLPQEPAKDLTAVTLPREPAEDLSQAKAEVQSEQPHTSAQDIGEPLPIAQQEIGAPEPVDEIRAPIPDEVGREPVPTEEVLATLQLSEGRKLAATGISAEGDEWWTTTWNRTLESGATVFCIGSPTGAACHDDAYLPSHDPVMMLSLGGWPPEFMALADAGVTITDVSVDQASVPFDQVLLDVPSRRSIAAIPLPYRSVEVSVTFVAGGQEGSLDVDYVSDITDEDFELRASAENISIDYGPTPGMTIGATTDGESES